MSRQKFTIAVIEPKDRKTPIQRYLVFGYSEYEAAGGMQDCLTDTDSEDGALGNIQAAITAGTARAVYDIFDTQTQRVKRIYVTTEPDDTFRVILKEIPEKGDKRNPVTLLIKDTLKILLLEARNYIEALPSFVGQGLSQADAVALAAKFAKLEATAVVEKE